MIRAGVQTFDETRQALNALDRLLDLTQRWVWVPTSTYSATLSNDTITVGAPLLFPAGTPLKYSLDGTERYGIVQSVSGDVLSVGGVTFSGANEMNGLWRGQPELARTVTLFVPGDYDEAAGNNIYLTFANSQKLWQMPPAYLVSVQMYNRNAESGATKPTLNPTIQGSRVLSSHLSVGTGWTTGGPVSTTTYRVVWNDAIDVDLVARGTNHDAQNLTVAMTFVME